ncbi:MAG: hypothetical protein COA42_21525 [Alteromonadaceae bacterium]|nr:MAG: hypothetical protein COA42_21525 [Alteromonadaceae bacterium]
MLEGDVIRCDSILVFGAKDHIGSELVKHIKKVAPHINLRLATHKMEGLLTLKKMFPEEEVVCADFFDKPSLLAAVQGMEGIFQISPDVFHEDNLVNNMLDVCEAAGTVKHIIRILGTPPGATLDLLPKALKKFRYYPAMQHLVATQRYQDSDLPVTFVNVAGYYMDDFTRMFSPSLYEEKTIRVAFDKRLAWVDHVDVAQVSAELLLSCKPENFRKIIDLTGPDILKFSQVAELFTKTLGVEVSYDGDEQRFFQAIKPVFTALWGEAAPEYFMKYFEWETEHDHMFKVTGFVKEILNREPTSFRAWILRNEDLLMDKWGMLETV